MPSNHELFQDALRCQQSGDLLAAAENCRQILSGDGRHADAWHLLGLVLQAQRRYSEAVACHREVLSIRPNASAAMGALAVSLQLLEQLDEAAAEYRRFLQFEPDSADARLNLATVLHKQWHLAEAETEYRHYLRLRAPHVDVLVQMGQCLQAQRKLAEAADCFRSAIALDPERDEPRFRLGAALLAAGDFDGGWPQYDWRLKRVARNFALPQWDGRPLDGRRVLIYSEWGQGLGDTLQFVRYLPLVQARGGEVALAVQPQLLPLLHTSGFQTAASVDRPPGDCHVQAALMSLPRILGTRLDCIPADVPYLSADDALESLWRQRLAAHDGVKIGIHWHGSQVAIRDGRVIPLAEFAALARVPGTILVSLQKQEGVEQIAAVADRFEVLDFGDQLDGEHGALMDTAALMKTLDLVVTNDTVTAHVAGALSVPVWVALVFSAEWRWLADRDDSPWYPTMRLFRQARIGDWQSVLEPMAHQLAALAAGPGDTRA
ncbi:MAG: tetratricopeptide repeat protein [Pirellulales bacterium]